MADFEINNIKYVVGVTIHFQGKLKSEEAYFEIIRVLKEVAADNHLPYLEFEEDFKKLERVRDEKDWDYEGPVKGITIQPDEDCEPLNFEFDKDLIVHDYCKTQFADIGIHIFIIDLLHSLEDFFEELIVDDEGEYWETGDEALLQQNIDNCFDAIEKLKKEIKDAEGPVKTESGRIIDLQY